MNVILYYLVSYSDKITFGWILMCLNTLLSKVFYLDHATVAEPPLNLDRTYLWY